MVTKAETHSAKIVLI